MRQPEKGEIVWKMGPMQCDIQIRDKTRPSRQLGRVPCVTENDRPSICPIKLGKSHLALGISSNDWLWVCYLLAEASRIGRPWIAHSPRRYPAWSTMGRIYLGRLRGSARLPPPAWLKIMFDIYADRTVTHHVFHPKAELWSMGLTFRPRPTRGTTVLLSDLRAVVQESGPNRGSNRRSETPVV